MNPRTSRTSRTWLWATGLAAALTACDAAPDALRPAPGATLALTASARGVQIYECRAGRWVFVAPQAELFDAAGRAIGTHGAGPYWQAGDGSRIVASVTASADAPVAGAIPWLLLTARRAPDGAVADGLLARVTHIQRVNTEGGRAPGGPCEAAGHSLRVPYRADYHFYRS